MRKYDYISIIAKGKDEIIAIQLLVFSLGKIWLSGHTTPIYTMQPDLAINIHFEYDTFGVMPFREDLGLYSRGVGFNCDPKTYTIDDKNIITSLIKSKGRMPSYKPRKK